MPKKGETISPELRQKMKEGQARAALARKQAADATALPAGALRNEQRAINKDALDERIETREQEAGIEAIDRSKLNQRDNEIMRHVRRRDKSSGVPVTGMEPGKRYAWLTLGTSFPDRARTAIRQMNADAKDRGYKPVEGRDNPVGKEFIGNDGMAGTTGRGVGDVYLAEIREEDYQDIEAESREKAERQGQVEDRSVVFARDRLGRAGLPNTMHNLVDPNDNFVNQRGRSLGVDRNPVTMTSQFTEGDVRRGSIHGPGGQVMKPGFERRI